MHRSGIEPELLAWKAKVMPLDHRCKQHTLHNETVLICIGGVTIYIHRNGAKRGAIGMYPTVK